MPYKHRIVVWLPWLVSSVRHKFQIREWGHHYPDHLARGRLKLSAKICIVPIFGNLLHSVFRIVS